MNRMKGRRPPEPLLKFGPRLLPAGVHVTEWVSANDHSQLDTSIAFERAIAAGRVVATLQADAGGEPVDLAATWTPLKRKGVTVPACRASVARAALGERQRLRIAFRVTGAPLIVGAAISGS